MVLHEAYASQENHMLKMVFVFFLQKIFKCLFLREREREKQSMSRGGGAEQEGDTGSEAGSRLTAQSPTRGSNSQTTRS